MRNTPMQQTLSGFSEASKPSVIVLLVVLVVLVVTVVTVVLVVLVVLVMTVSFNAPPYCYSKLLSFLIHFQKKDQC